MVILYSSIGIVSIFILMSIFMKYQNENIKKKKLDDITNVVTQFQIFSDGYLLEKVYSIITKDIFKDNGYNLDLIQDSWIYEYKSSDFTNVLNINKYLKSLEVNTEYIESITIYNKQNDTYISSRTGIYYDIMKKQEGFSSMINYGLLEAIKNADFNQFWYSPNENKDFYKDRSIVSLVQFTPIFIPAAQANIIVSVNIDINRVFKDFFAKVDLEKDNFKIIDHENKLLFDTNNNNLLYDDEGISLSNKIEESSSGYEKIKQDDKWQHTIWRTSSTNSWKYIYTVKDEGLLRTFFYPLGYILIWGLIITTMVLIAILFIGKWLYEPLNNLVKLSTKRLEEFAPEGDITTIKDAFSNINNKLDQLEDIVEKNDALILNNIITNLMNGKITTTEELNNRLKILNKEFTKESFCILLIEIDPTEYKAFNHEEKELTHITTNEILSRYYNEDSNKGLKMTAIFDYDGYFTCIINLDEEDYDLELVHARDILKILNNQFTPIFNFALTKPFSDLNSFHKYHQNTLDYFKYGFIYGNNNVFTEESIREYEQSSTQGNKGDMQTLEVYLKKQELDLVKENIMALFNQIKLNGYSYLYMYNLSIQLIGLISNECMIQNISNPELGQHYLLESYSTIQNLDDCMSWFYSVIDKFGKSVEERNMGMEGTIVGNIVEYIKGNIDDQLSLNSVADYFNLSTGHISRLFKDKVGTNFSDFVSAIKFEKAAELLILNPKMKVSDIAEQLGYSSLTYFTKLFKEKHGMTPTQYRKLHQ